MNASDIIRKKRDGHPLSAEEIACFISGVTSGTVPDYQTSALLMAVYFNGMTPEEVFYLTHSMLHSGKTMDLSAIGSYKVDKHSTGGVGDKISIILAPLAASLGCTVPMISGRGLGHTGGTLDKLESIPGFKTSIPTDELKEILKRSHIAMIGQTGELAPADKKIYGLRDVTATVESIPLITASILSKKLASGIDGVVFDIKVGRGAFMKSRKEAMALSRSIQRVMKRSEKDSACLLTDMNEPLGRAVGNSLEIAECIDVLKGKGPADIIELTVELTAWMLRMSGIEKKIETAKKLALENLRNGKALARFKEMVANQGGNPSVADDTSLLGKADFLSEIHAEKSGFLKGIDPLTLGFSMVRLGAGRARASDPVDHTVGMVLEKKAGAKVSKGDLLATVHYNSKDAFSEESEILKACFEISRSKPRRNPLIIDRIT